MEPLAVWATMDVLEIAAAAAAAASASVCAAVLSTAASSTLPGGSFGAG